MFCTIVTIVISVIFDISPASFAVCASVPQDRDISFKEPGCRQRTVRLLGHRLCRLASAKIRVDIPALRVVPGVRPLKIDPHELIRRAPIPIASVRRQNGRRGDKEGSANPPKTKPCANRKHTTCPLRQALDPAFHLLRRRNCDGFGHRSRLEDALGWALWGDQPAVVAAEERTKPRLKSTRIDH